MIPNIKLQLRAKLSGNLSMTFRRRTQSSGRNKTGKRPVISIAATRHSFCSNGVGNSRCQPATLIKKSVCLFHRNQNRRALKSQLKHSSFLKIEDFETKRY
jgi:hypothetical protein